MVPFFMKIFLCLVERLAESSPSYIIGVAFFLLDS